MAAKPLTDAQLQAALDAVRTHGTQEKAAQALGLNARTFDHRWKQAKAWAKRMGVPVPTKAQTGSTVAVPVDGISVRGDRAELSRMTSTQIRSLADLIRVCEIDMSEWDVERYICNKWEVGAKVGPQEDATIQVTPLFQVKAWLVRKAGVMAAKDEIAALIADAKRKIPVRKPMAVISRASGNLLEPSIPDLHVGKLAWAKETGWENYDSRIAADIFADALHALIARTESFKPERILLPIGNDLLHSDTKQGTTTGGTPLDMDSRYHKVFSVVRRMMTAAIDQCRSIAPVTVIVVPGNHDTLSAWHLGDSLECYFHKCKDVTIDNTPSMRKYFQWTKVMLMLTHGNKGKLADYPLVMAAEQPKMFGETTWREAHTGDKHQLKVQEHHGVKVRISPALCPPDAWHAEHHFVGNARAAEAFVFNKHEGLIGMANYTVPAPKSEAA